MAGRLGGLGDRVGCGQAEFFGPALDVGPEPVAFAKVVFGGGVGQDHRGNGGVTVQGLAGEPGHFPAVPVGCVPGGVGGLVAGHGGVVDLQGQVLNSGSGSWFGFQVGFGVAVAVFAGVQGVPEVGSGGREVVLDPVAGGHDDHVIGGSVRAAWAWRGSLSYGRVLWGPSLARFLAVGAAGGAARWCSGRRSADVGRNRWRVELSGRLLVIGARRVGATGRCRRLIGASEADLRPVRLYGAAGRMRSTAVLTGRDRGGRGICDVGMAGIRRRWWPVAGAGDHRRGRLGSVHGVG